jgi:hypothetical protein
LLLLLSFATLLLPSKTFVILSNPTPGSTKHVLRAPAVDIISTNKQTNNNNHKTEVQKATTTKQKNKTPGKKKPNKKKKEEEEEVEEESVWDSLLLAQTICFDSSCNTSPTTLLKISRASFILSFLP